ncbi:hypothetical protein BDZ97DRAFT_1919752 [Flammula alnicola]|nr:hypothetical protein BDZ97DRAFT_1919752 [Flammula alnicola]
MATLTDVRDNEQDKYPAGTEVFFWNTEGKLEYATVQSSMRFPQARFTNDSILLLVVKLRDQDRVVSLPAAGVCVVEPSPVCSPLPIFYRLLAKL